VIKKGRRPMGSVYSDCSDSGAENPAEPGSAPAKPDPAREEKVQKMSGAGGEDLPELRFALGDRVTCRTGPGNGEDAWSAGTVIKQWYREANWPASRVAPYQIKLDDGRKIFAPMDDDRVIKTLTGLLIDGKIPVTVLTGFLGSGKTTLLNYILKAQHGRKYAIIENEVGAVGVDNQLLKSASGFEKSNIEEQIVLLDNGCLCCTVRGDLVDAIKGIVEKAKDKEKALGKQAKTLDAIIIETTGIADPGPICKTFYGDPFCSAYCRIDGVITLVDCVHFVEQLTRERSEGTVNESAQQIAFADKVLLNKVDAASPEKIEQTIQALRGVNEFVPVTKCSVAKSPEAIPLQELLSIDAFDLTKMLEKGDIDLSQCGTVTEGAEKDAHGGGHGHECDDECDEHGGGHGGGHGSGHGGGHGGGYDGHGHGGGHDAGHGGHGHGHGHGFRHDTGIGSFVCELRDKPISVEKFNSFMHELLQESENLYRYKGFLAMEDPRTGKVMRRVLQGVHDMVDMDAGDEWPADQKIKSQVVLIGRKLDKVRWTAEFSKLAI